MRIAASLLELSELSLVTGLDYVDPWLVFVHRVEDEIAELVQVAVGDLELLKGDYLLLPHCPRGRGIRLYVEFPRRGQPTQSRGTCICCLQLALYPML